MVGRFDDSLRYFEITEKYNKNEQNLQYMLGMTYDQLHKTKAAINKYQQCVDMGNNKEFAGYCKSNIKRLESAR